jgi:hypothetical protein
MLEAMARNETAAAAAMPPREAGRQISAQNSANIRYQGASTPLLAISMTAVGSSTTEQASNTRNPAPVTWPRLAWNTKIAQEEATRAPAMANPAAASRMGNLATTSAISWGTNWR